ncbi:hypothetical protein [Mesorhizobium sp.]|uniref:hypothetical protein n=1 Tax=Mesorhizobium sp. TaxID=1871066 RepID=UPI002580996F|nr:hypothetical protein [Mesorhizobium sp.]
MVKALMLLLGCLLPKCLLFGGLLLAGCATPVSPARQVWCDHNQPRRASAASSPP